MASKTAILFALSANICLASGSGDRPKLPSGVCMNQPKVVASCRWIVGSVEIYNGTPPIRIKELKTKRWYAVGPSEDELMPSDLKQKLTPESKVFVKMKICPIASSTHRGFHEVCIDQAEDVRGRSAK